MLPSFRDQGLTRLLRMCHLAVRILIRLALGTLVFGLASAGQASAAPVVTGVRTGVHADMTRIVLDMTEGVGFQVFLLDNPYRAVVDMNEVTWQVSPDKLRNQGLIKGMRFGLFTAGTSRVVLDLTGPAKVHRAFSLAPRGGSGHRLVIDLAGIAGSQFKRSTGKRSNKPKVLFTPPKPAQKPNPKPVIVLDPGHGGVDPGAIGGRGVYEKNVTLRVARELREKLLKTKRYKVVLTRDRDVFVRLRNRVAKGRAVRGDLFISLHADSIGKRSVRGASVYTLSERASDKEAAALARRENKADIIAGMDFGEQSEDVANILIDLAQRETMNLSATFANIAVNKLADSVRVLRRSHRFAGFAVLKAPDVPSVLVEMGYLSNAQDERMLNSPKRRAKLVAALVTAIDKYFQKGAN